MKRNNSKITKKLKKIYSIIFKNYYESFTEFLECKWVKLFRTTHIPVKYKTERLNKKLKNRKLRYSKKQQIKDGLSCSDCEFNNLCNKKSVYSENNICKDFRD